MSQTESEKLEKAFNKTARWAYDNKKTRITTKDLENNNVKSLMNEINNVLQEALQASISHEIAPALLKHLQTNVYMFSRAKTYTELEEIRNMLYDKKGNIKPFSKFFKDVRKVHNDYNKAYLESEYIFASQSARMASKWADFEKYGDRYYLQYRTANDDRVRADHRALHDTTLPIDDTFWSKFFPPNGWRCRCDVVQVRKSKYPVSDSATANDLGNKATYTIRANGVNTSEIFRFNPGKEKTIFPESHPYFDALNK